MCELLGMSANVPTDICFSFTGFLHRGGGTGPHRDGWGIAFYEEGGYREFRDPHPSVHSRIARLICEYPIKSHIVISHIRQANVGQVKLANTHPFVREMWGQPWCYAHNGQLTDWQQLELASYRPVGSTDSEHAFCHLLGELRRHYPDPPEDRRGLWQTLHQLCEKLRGLGVFNLLLADGEYLYTFCSTKLAHITRRAPFGEANLSDADMVVNFIEHTTPNDVVSVLATEPLTDNEKWTRMLPGELLVWRDGEIVARFLSEQDSAEQG
ncbi:MULTISPECIES: class II glutamine amidotransferase [Halomonas]|uniref:class II glutamine amidotransferase n=1 Tax=Halomonas TaxID=2745 RepID=UPI001C957743|nr:MULTISPECIES: class II glutamine amidotransferase [Halomonas]MED5296702.1 class II glutamine amidotransferase [Pseudomonadota bacterium]MBY5925677.1 class II glutamine amidotransferase [Halomonas sp. DP4Y7-2]MBY5930659.1 class II glutamine amidotransferase [Halomonas sp. DP8Y7-3]MBY5969285.1 class II glutamine amidotransferase [Halomonas denitrificans]MBY5984912.1 class II glutamine amidotransferase [Halomonas sp. DP5Y7-2]